MTEGTEETITDPEEAPAKRTMKRSAKKTEGAEKETTTSIYSVESGFAITELRKLQHAAARGSSASAAEWAKVSKAADKALALLLPDKGPRPMEVSTVYMCQEIVMTRTAMRANTRTPRTSGTLRLSSVEPTRLSKCDHAEDHAEQWLSEDFLSSEV